MNENVKFNILIHLYLFGPKYKSKSEKPTAYAEVKQSVDSEFGEEIDSLSIREVRDIAVNNLQYCVTFRLCHNVVDKKRIKIG